ncbi:uncharacterized protein LOC122550194 [Chiloscyllium plagiosum]|uniref:uncharacterized protein LOC122550194 n=1 Tax=Chiloscyllium plagiosum TaxID=36176 RepID=UPI001CB84996|nr:uncharacterized protein LOC122550194 [Chiloscyllium plagiosum]
MSLEQLTPPFSWEDGGKVDLGEYWSKLPFPISAFLRRLDDQVTPHYIDCLLSNRPFSFGDGAGVEFCGDEYLYGSEEPGSNEVQFYVAYGEISMKMRKKALLNLLKLIFESRSRPFLKNTQECLTGLNHHLKRLERQDATIQKLFKAVAQNDWKTLICILNKENFSESEFHLEDYEIHLDAFVRNENGFTLLHQAVCANRPEMIDFLWYLSDAWECLVDLTIDSPWCPKWPVEILQQKPVDSELVGHLSGKNAMQMAEILGYHKVLKALNAKVKLQSSLLNIHCAVKLKDTEWLKNIILESQCIKTIVNDCMENMVTPLWLACTKGDLQTVKLLIDFGADTNMNSTNEQEQTILHRAVCFGNIAVVQYLIEGNYLGVDVKDRYGCTPLYYALQLNLPRMSKLLLMCGADLDLQCVNPHTLTTDSARLLLERLEFQRLRQILLESPQLEAEIDDFPIEVDESTSFSGVPIRIMSWPFSLTGSAVFHSCLMQGFSCVSMKPRTELIVHYYFNLSHF